MGLQGLALALLSGEIYREHALQNHKTTIERLIEIRIDQLLVDLASKSQQLGLSQQQQPEFKRAIHLSDVTELTRILNSHFHRYFVTASILKLEKLIVFDRQFSFVAETTEGNTRIPERDLVCDALIADARSLTGADRLKIKSGVCEKHGKAYHMVIIPIGGLLLKGYMAVVTDPVNNLIAMEQDLGMPMKFMYPSGETAYKSKNWDAIRNNQDYLLSDYRLPAYSGQTSLHIETIENLEPLYNQMPDIRTIVMISASLITGIASIVALIIIHKTTLSPLGKINRLLSMIRTDKTRLGDKLEVKGVSEIRQLSTSFNEMTSQLEELYGRMEEMAFTDQLTRLPNRHLFNKKLDTILSVLQFTGSGFALLMMDLNRFKPINDELGHRIGDQVLQEVGRRLKATLRADDNLLLVDDQDGTDISDTVARLGGDEFAAIIRDVQSPENARLVAEKIMDALDAPVEIDNYRLDVGISIGIALYPQDGENDRDLLHKADLAMYEAKHNQRHYVFFGEIETPKVV